MNTPIEEFKRSITTIERAKGINSATAKIIGEIFACPTEISIEKLAQITGYSLATISNAVKLIEQYGAVTKIKKPGSKRIYVKAERDFMKLLINNMNRTHEIAIRPLQQLLPDLITKQKKLIKQEEQKTKKNQLKEELTIFENHLTQVNMMEALVEHVISQCSKNRKKT